MGESKAWPGLARQISGANRKADVRIVAGLARKGTQHPSFRSRLFLVRTLLLFAWHPKRLSRRAARQREKVTLWRVRLSWESKTRGSRFLA